MIYKHNATTYLVFSMILIALQSEDYVERFVKRVLNHFLNQTLVDTIVCALR